MPKKSVIVERRGLRGYILAASGFVFGLYILVVLAQPVLFAGRFGLNSHIADVNVSGKTYEEAKILLTERWNGYKNSEITVYDTKTKADTLISSPKVDQTINEAALEEQSGYFGFSKFTAQQHDFDLAYNDENIGSLLGQIYDNVATKPVDAQITDVNTGTIQPEINGQRLLLVESHEKLRSELESLPTSADVVIVAQRPVLTANDATGLVNDAQVALAQPVSVDIKGENTEISTAQLESWLKITPLSPATLLSRNDWNILGANNYNFLDPNKVFLYVDNIAKNVNVMAQNSTLAEVNGALTVTKASVTGQTVDEDKAITDIQQAVTGTHEVTIAISTQKPEVREDNLASLGITELISEGVTDASGSPKNRIHNYTVGTSKFDNVLIQPGEDFSFNKALGAVDASTGYLPELVILADKTVPEYGGGLCQVSSTAFRAALNAGLPILERHAHAYPVGYYKPYGVDATIYLPSPDLRFQNDTGHYILIQTRVVGNHVYFDFYGTKKPGRIAFSGSPDPVNEVANVEKVTPTLSEQGVRGRNSFTAVIYRHIYDASGKMTDDDKFTSKYDSPDKYPH